MVVRWGRIIECDSQETAGWSQESSELYDRRLDNYIIAQIKSRVSSLGVLIVGDSQETTGYSQESSEPFRGCLDNCIDSNGFKFRRKSKIAEYGGFFLERWPSG